MLGYRVWTLRGHRLATLNPEMGVEWELGDNTAVCLRTRFKAVMRNRRPLPSYYPHLDLAAAPTCTHVHPDFDHQAPAKECGCGLYAYHSVPATPAWRSQIVIGAIVAWGQIESHVRGFRAQHARPVVLAYTNDQSPEHLRRLFAVAEEFEIPVVPLERLQGTARKLASPIPDDLRPVREMVELQQSLHRAISSLVLHMTTAQRSASTYASVVRRNTKAKRRARRIAALVNAAAFAFNGGLFIAEPNAASPIAMAVSGALAIGYWRGGRRP